MTYCPPNCPNRALHCHGTCQHYLKAYVLHTLTDKRAARRASDERAFHAEESARVAEKRDRRNMETRRNKPWKAMPTAFVQ